MVGNLQTDSADRIWLILQSIGPLLALATYLAIGVAVTGKFSPPGRRVRIPDWCAGALFMPVVAILWFGCSFLRRFWAGLLVVLDYQPVE